MAGARHDGISGWSPHEAMPLRSIGWAAERFELSIAAYLAGMIRVRESYVAFQHAAKLQRRRMI